MPQQLTKLAQVPPPTLEELLRQIEDRAALLRYAADSAATNRQPPDPKVLAGLRLRRDCALADC